VQGSSPSKRLTYLWYESWYCLTWAVATLGLSFRYEGGRNVPRKGPVLLLANHQSFFDPVLVGVAARRHLHYLARKTLFRSRLFSSFLRSVNCVPVDQEGVAKEGLKATVELLRAGKAVLVFPEGERSWEGPMQPFKPGIHLLLKRAPATVVPVGVAGAFESFPRTAKHPILAPLFLPAARRGPVAVSIGRPLDARRFLEMPREEMLQALFHEVQSAQQRAERLRRKP
jgi:1-acyl-sn-glycerol-3-phosphate acyltransferase